MNQDNNQTGQQGYGRDQETDQQNQQPKVDLTTGEPSRAAYERSDVTAVPACGVIAEAMLAFVLADALLETLGNDRLEDVLSRLAAHRERVRGYTLAPKP